MAQLLQILKDPDAATLRAALDAPDLMHSTISEWLAGRGHKIAPETISRHRRGKCSCDD